MMATRDNPPAPVVIVGAGPTGLSLALGLARHGVRSTVVEKAAATSEYSKAAGIHVRTREIFRQWGIEDRVLEAGVLVARLTQWSVRSGGAAASYDFSELDPEVDLPGLLMLEQGETERILLTAVRESGLCQVRFGAEAVRLDAGAASVRVVIREDGVEASLDAQFVVGCDGASSFVREALGLPFEGITYGIRPMLADVRIDDERDGSRWPRVLNRRGGLTIGLRIRPHLWRIIRIEAASPEGDDVSDDEVHARVREVLGRGAADVVWASRFRIHRRSSPRFRVGRVLLAGDAAHVHSPVGGQGMNAGIQDSHNLAWKLAAVLSGAPPDPLLDSYEVERRAVVVEHVSSFTGFLTRVFLQTPAVVREAAFGIVRMALRIGRIRRRLLRTLTMIDLGYTRSPILERGERAAGARLPNVRLRGAGGEDVRLYDLLPTGPVIIEVTEQHPASPAKLPVRDVIRIGADGYHEPAGLLRGLLGGHDGWILVRPDAHIAWARVGTDGIEDAVRRALGSAGQAA